MKSPKISSGEFVKVDAGWTDGMNTLRSSWLLSEQQYRRSTNIVNRGGVAQTRPGYDMKLILPPGNLQGGELFLVNKGDRYDEWVVFAVEGNVYASPFPLLQPRSWEQFRLKNIQFDPKAKYVHFCVAEKTVTLTDNQTLKITPTYNVLMMQDGISSAAFWDGEENRHLSEADPSLETPSGSWMAFSGGRLWVARGKILIASNAYDPLRFTERLEGDGRGDFSYPREITGLKSFVSGDSQEVVTVFTDERTELIRSGVRDRSKWAATANFQSVLFPSTGCDSGHSIVFQAGLMWWHSAGGLVSSDSAAVNNLTSQVNFRDAEMAFSKQFLSEDQSMICGLSFENYILVSMPIGETLNSETFVMDYSLMSENGSDRRPAWSSVWTGIRPMQWLSGRVGTRRRAFALSVDYAALSDGSFNHLWEAFMPDREDTFFELASDFSTTQYRQPIFCEFESRMLGDGLDLKAMKYAELDFKELSGDVGIQVDYRGTRGSYKTILSKSIVAPSTYETAGVSSLSENEDVYGQLRKQSRRLATQMAKDGVGEPTCESQNAENIDKAFSVLVRWCGQAALESIKLYLEPFAENAVGSCEQDETKACVVDEFGQNHEFARDKGFIPVGKLYSAVSRKQWISTRTDTQSLSCPEDSVTGPISVTASATYRSEISQADADSNAQSLAEDSAANQASYLRSIYPCYWDSVKYSERFCYGVLNGTVRAMAALSNGQVVLGGEFYQDHATQQGKVTLRHSDGTRILTYANQNAFVDSFGSEPSAIAVNAMARAADDAVVFVGAFTKYTNQPRIGIARLLSDGQIDPSATFGLGFTGGTPTCIAIQSDNSMIVGGSFTAYDGAPASGPLARLDNFGVQDPAFITSDFSIIYAVGLTAGGQAIIVGRDFTTGDFTVSRLLSDGSVDGTFTQYVEAMAASGFAAIKIQSSGKILLSAPGLNIGKNLIRLNSDGSVDATYNVGTGLNVAARSITEDSLGNVFLAGGFTGYNGATVSKVIKTDSTGARSVAFSTGSGFDGTIYALHIDASGILWVGGAFTSYDGEVDEQKLLRIDSITGEYLPSFQSTTQGAAVRSTVDQADADSSAQDVADAKALEALPCT